MGRLLMTNANHADKGSWLSRNKTITWTIYFV
jgi:hypothetical protein